MTAGTLSLEDGTAPGTPPSGYVYIYSRSGILYKKDDTGTETAVGSAAAGLPTGGTTGQILAKVDGTDYNTTWVTNSGMVYRGNWNASTNTPSLADGTGTTGDVYRVSVADTINLGSGYVVYHVDDYLNYDGSIWRRMINAAGAVASVNGATGTVVLVTDDIAEDGSPSNLWFTTARAKAATVQDAINDGITDVAPSQNAVFDALTGKLSNTFPIIAPETVSPTISFGFSETGNDTGWGSDTDGAQFWTSNAVETMRLDPSGNLSTTGNFTATGNLAAANYPPTGSNNTIAGFSGSGQIYSIPNWSLLVTGGLSQDLTQHPNNVPNGDDVNSIVSKIEPLQDSPSDSSQAFTLRTFLDNASSGFSFGTDGRAVTNFTNNVFHSGTGDVGEVQMMSHYASLGNGTDPIDVGGFAFSYGFANFNDNITLTQNINGYGFSPQLSSGVTFASGKGVVSFFDSLNGPSVSFNGYTSANFSPNIGTIENNSNYTGMAIGPTIGTISGNANATGVSIYGNWGSADTGTMFGVAVSQNITSTQGYVGVQVNPNVSEVTGTAQGLAVFMNNVAVAAGVKASVTIQDIFYESKTDGTNLNSIDIEYQDTVSAGSEVAILTGGTHIVVSIESGVSTATQVLAALTANSTLNSNLNFTITGTAGNAQVTQAPTFFAGGLNPGRKQAGYFQGDVQIDGALQFSGSLSIGGINSFANYTLVDGGGAPGSATTLITAPTAAANATIANADVLGVNTASLITIGDNATITTAFLGIAALGLPAVLSMGTGSTVDRVAGAVFALSLDAGATGGTVDQVSLCRSLAIPNGATTVNRLYGYEMSLPFGSVGTNSWGVYIATTSNNWMAGSLRIGGTTLSDDKVTNTSVGLELTDKAFRHANLDTTARDALTALRGMQIYNTDTDTLEYYNGTSWI